MEIIKQGKNKYLDYIEYIKKCPNCKCKFTYTKYDWIKNSFKRSFMCNLIYCPRCGERIDINYFSHKKYKKHYTRGE